jgi:hypothetical protein
MSTPGCIEMSLMELASKHGPETVIAPPVLYMDFEKTLSRQVPPSPVASPHKPFSTPLLISSMLCNLRRLQSLSFMAPIYLFSHDSVVSFVLVKLVYIDTPCLNVPVARQAWARATWMSLKSLHSSLDKMARHQMADANNNRTVRCIQCHPSCHGPVTVGHFPGFLRRRGPKSFVIPAGCTISVDHQIAFPIDK